MKNCLLGVATSSGQEQDDEHYDHNRSDITSANFSLANLACVFYPALKDGQQDLCTRQTIGFYHLRLEYQCIRGESYHAHLVQRWLQPEVSQLLSGGRR